MDAGVGHFVEVLVEEGEGTGVGSDSDKKFLIFEIGVETSGNFFKTFRNF